MTTTSRSLLSLVALSVFAVGCGQAGSADDPATAAAPVATTAAAPGQPDMAKGKMLFLQCRACHSLEEGGPNKVGPNLWGVFGRKAGTAPGFLYSDVLAKSDLVWTDENMSHWLEKPSEFLPGNRMVFVGLKKPEDRASVIAYVKAETGAK